MPRPRKPAPASSPAFEPANSHVASAARITARRKDRPLGNGLQPWQQDAWHFYDSCGELAAATQWTANAMSQVKLRLVKDTADGEADVPDDSTDELDRLALDALASLFDGDTDEAQMMAAFGVHLSIPGECYLVGLAPNDADGDYGRDSWRVVSNEELKETAPGSGRWELDRGDGVIEKLQVAKSDAQVDPSYGDEALIIRVWRPHPRKYVEATSPVRAALPVLRELEGLTKRVASAIDSRLAGAGILLVPSEMTFQTPLVDGQPAGEAGLDQFISELAAAMAAALQDQGNPASRVPIVVKAPGEYLDAVKHITFENPLDEQSVTLREEQIRRLALTLDMPPEELLGKGDVNHWGQWLISEESIKLHIDPLADTVATAVQTRYLWPAMQGPSMVMDPRILSYRLVPDTSELRQRTLDFGQTMAMHTAMLISDEAMLRESRFDVGDKPTDEEKQRRFTELVASSGASPDVVAAAIQIVTGGAVTPIPVQTDEPTALDEEPSSPPALAPVPTPTPATEDRTPPSPTAPGAPTAAAALDAVLAASELAVERAVERAWNRAGKRGAVRRPVEAARLDTALQGAWSSLPRTAATLGVDEARLTSALDRYARGLLQTGAAHDQRILARLLAEQVLAGSAVA